MYIASVHACMGGPGNFYSQQGILFRKERIYLAMHAVRPV